MRNSLKFLLGVRAREISEIDPTMTVLDWLREHEGLTGTKEGCAEGDCGACTVVLGEARDGEMRYRAVNACIQFMPCLDGKQLITVEDVAAEDGTLHDIQQAMVETHASQCGFCTPGFVMSIYAQWLEGAAADRREIHDAIAGNLCRCTGYGPIVAAAEQTLGQKPARRNVAKTAASTAKTLSDMRDGGLEISGPDGRRFFAPATLKELEQLTLDYPDATLIAGLTDAGLWVTKQHQVLDTVIYLGNVAELRVLNETKEAIEISAAVTYAEAHELLGRHFPDFGELLRRLGGLQVRNVGTICGNIANGSPIGDSPPALIALDARLVLNKGGARREIALEEFFIEYGKQDRQPSEFVEKVIVPKLEKNHRFRCYKIAKRFDQDISAVMAAFRLTLDDAGKVENIRIAYGGMAGTPKRAARAEAALVGKSWNEGAVDAAMAAMNEDFSPLTDMRGSADYRMVTARNLLKRFYLETTTGTPLRVYENTIDASREAAP